MPSITSVQYFNDFVECTVSVGINSPFPLFDWSLDVAGQITGQSFYVGASVVRPDGSTAYDFTPIQFISDQTVKFLNVSNQILTGNTFVISIWNAYPSASATRLTTVRLSGNDLITNHREGILESIGQGVGGFLGSIGNIIPLAILGFVVLEARK